MKSTAFTIIGAIVAGCSTPANPPSLLPRAIETRSETVTPAAPALASQMIDPALMAKLAALLAEARAGDADFMKAEASGIRALETGRSAAPGTEGWVAAELVQSALQVARQRSAGALAQIDTIAVNQGEAAARDRTISGLDEIVATQSQIEAIVARQNARLESLSR